MVKRKCHFRWREQHVSETYHSSCHLNFYSHFHWHLPSAIYGGVEAIAIPWAIDDCQKFVKNTRMRVRFTIISSNIDSDIHIKFSGKVSINFDFAAENSLRQLLNTTEATLEFPPKFATCSCCYCWKMRQQITINGNTIAQVLHCRESDP